MNRPSELPKIRRRLLRWYESHQRPLPWRKTKDPYAIWIAETMLQQTQVQTAIPFYRRFLSSLPTLTDLDRAPKARVMSLWSGLGYYRRAENLKKAARVMSRRHGGKIPAEFETLLTLPGIGLYTAGAVMSIAFDRPFPAVDGNARRVLSRLFKLNGNSELTKTAWQLVPRNKPGHFNQALMELGAILCAPRDPNCTACPLISLCPAAAAGWFPKNARSGRRRTRKVSWPLVIVENGGRVLLRRREQQGILAGLWEIPGGENQARETPQSALTRHLRVPQRRKNALTRIGEIRHSITHHRITSPVFVYSNSRRFRLPGSQWRWVPIGSLGRYPLSSLSLKAVGVFNSWRDYSKSPP